MGLIINFCFALLVLIVAFVFGFHYYFGEFDSTAKLASVVRHCYLGLNPNYTVYDEFNIGIDSYAQHFHNKEKLNSACNIIQIVLKDFVGTLAQRTYYFDKQIINIFKNNSDYKQFVLLGAGIIRIILYVFYIIK